MSQFYLGSGPLWAWVYSVLDPQDAINELMNCVLRVLRAKNGGPMWNCRRGSSQSQRGSKEVLVRRCTGKGCVACCPMRCAILERRITGKNLVAMVMYWLLPLG